jgi:hypothetical protein
MLTSNHVCTRPYHHVWINSVHNIWIARFANTNDDAIFDSNVRLDDTRPVDDKGIRNDSVKGIGIRASSCLSHALSYCLTASKRALITIYSHVFLHLNPKISGAQPYAIASGRAKHGDVSLSFHCADVDVSSITQWLRLMQEAP